MRCRASRSLPLALPDWRAGCCGLHPAPRGGATGARRTRGNERSAPVALQRVGALQAALRFDEVRKQIARAFAGDGGVAGAPHLHQQPADVGIRARRQRVERTGAGDLLNGSIVAAQTDEARRMIVPRPGFVGIELDGAGEASFGRGRHPSRTRAAPDPALHARRQAGCRRRAPDGRPRPPLG